MYPSFMPDFNKTWIYLTSFPKIFKYQISYKSFIGNQVVAHGQTNGHDETDSRFSQFWEGT